METCHSPSSLEVCGEVGTIAFSLPETGRSLSLTISTSQRLRQNVELLIKVLRDSFPTNVAEDLIWVLILDNPTEQTSCQSSARRLTPLAKVSMS